jgi:hypothetical protein
MVASVLEEAPSVFGTNRPQCYAYRFYQSLFRSGRGLAEQVLDLGEGLFYGVVVGGVRRQVEQFTPSALKQSSPMRFGLWAERLSITTIRPLCRVGTSTFSM